LQDLPLPQPAVTLRSRALRAQRKTTGTFFGRKQVILLDNPPPPLAAKHAWT